MSPVVSMTTSPMTACGPDFVSQTTPLTAPSWTTGRENQLCSRRLTPLSRTRSLETRFQPSGSKATA